jgi:heptosyltransferase-2
MPPVLHKTLIIRFSSIGDIVLSSLLVRAFRRRYPECQLDFVVKEEFADLVRYNPHIAHVITFPRRGSVHDLRQLRARVREAKYDLIIDIHDSLRSRFLCFGAKRVVRIDKRKFERFLLVNLKLNWYERFGGAPSVALRYLEPVREFGVADDGQGLEFFCTDDVRVRVDQRVRDSGFEAGDQFIAVCPSAKHNTKMWLKERFAEAASALSKKYGHPVVLFGSGESEVRRCDEIEEAIRALRSASRTSRPEPRILNLAGKLSLAETAAMMDKCAIVITNDSGLMHLAAARKCNVVAIFGPTVKELGFFPFGTRSVVVENSALACRPCTHIGLPSCPKGHFKCMNDVSVQEVLDAATQLLRAE